MHVDAEKIHTAAAAVAAPPAGLVLAALMLVVTFPSLRKALFKKRRAIRPDEAECDAREKTADVWRQWKAGGYLVWSRGWQLFRQGVGQWTPLRLDVEVNTYKADCRTDAKQMQTFKGVHIGREGSIKWQQVMGPGSGVPRIIPEVGEV